MESFPCPYPPSFPSPLSFSCVVLLQLQRGKRDRRKGRERGGGRGSYSLVLLGTDSEQHEQRSWNGMEEEEGSGRPCHPGRLPSRLPPPSLSLPPLPPAILHFPPHSLSLPSPPLLCSVSVAAQWNCTVGSQSQGI